MLTLLIGGGALFLGGAIGALRSHPDHAGATGILVLIVGAVMLGFQLTPLFQNNHPTGSLVLLLQAVGATLTVFTLLSMWARPGMMWIRVYGEIGIPVLLLPALVAAACLGFPYSLWYQGEAVTPSARIDRPLAGAILPANATFSISGDVSGLPRDGTLWILIGSGAGESPDLYFTDNGPSQRGDGPYSVDQTFESSAAGPKTILAIYATRNCTDALQDTRNNPKEPDNYLHLGALPDAYQCRVIARESIAVTP